MKIRIGAIWILLIITFVLQESPVNAIRSRRQIIFPDKEDETEERTPSAGSTCLTPDRRRGNCVQMTNCPALRRLNFNRLRRFFCGFEGEEPKVCCPSTTGDTTAPRPRGTPPGRNAIPTTLQPTRRPTPRVTTRRSTPSRPNTRATTQQPPAPVKSTTVSPASSNLEKPAFLPADCGNINSTKTRIVGGREAEKGSWPWMAVVYQQKRRVKSPDCGGALVTTRHVITAAHCVVGRGATTLSPSVLSVRLGEHDLFSNNDSMNPIDVEVESVIRHPDFDPRTYRNDIAVLKLAKPVQFRRHVFPICLPYDSLKDQDLTSRRAFVAGWGTTSFNGPSSPVLREAAFDIQDQEFCRKAYEKELPITDVYLCAGTADGSKDSCQGDSGGPLMSVGKKNRYYLVGVVSFGKLCAQPGYPGVYTRVTKYLDWLKTVLAT